MTRSRSYSPFSISRRLLTRFSTRSSRRRRKSRSSLLEPLEDRRMLAITAVDDCYNVLRNTPMLSTSPAATLCDSYEYKNRQPSVLENDLPDPAELTAEQAGFPSHGVMAPEVDNGGFFGYVPDEGFLGTDYFDYLATDGTNSDIGTVELRVHRAPYGQDDVYIAAPDTSFTVNAADGVLKNDRDPDRGSYTTGLEVDVEQVTDPQYGTLDSISPDGSFTYTPPAGFVGVDLFTYKNYDGGFWSEPIEVQIVVPPTPTLLWSIMKAARTAPANRESPASRWWTFPSSRRAVAVANSLRNSCPTST